MFLSHMIPAPPHETDNDSNSMREFFFIQTCSAQCLQSTALKIGLMI